ncbi:MAG: hypothetical protein GXY98_06225 [Erysipelothrix sp.]|nr:hypothetical protein [Erysipelothrix sp.]
MSLCQQYNRQVLEKNKWITTTKTPACCMGRNFCRANQKLLGVNAGVWYVS